MSAWGDVRPAGYAATAAQFLDEAARGDERDLAVRQLAALQGIGYGLLAVGALLDDANDATVQCAQSIDEVAAAVDNLYRAPLGERVRALLPGARRKQREGGRTS